MYYDELQNIELDNIIALKQQTRAELEEQIQKLGEKLSILTPQYETVCLDFSNKTRQIEEFKKEINSLEEKIKEFSLTKEDLEKRVNYLINQKNKNKDLTLKNIELEEKLDTTEKTLKNSEEILQEIRRQVDYNLVFKNTILEEVRIKKEEYEEFTKKIALIEEKEKQLKVQEKEMKETIERNEAILKETEQKKKEFIENPLSIGHYAEKIKKKTGINVIDYML